MKLLILVFLIVFTSPLYAFQPQVIPLSSPIYSLTRMLFTLVSGVDPLPVTPWSVYQLEQILNRLPPDLPPSASSLVGQIQSSVFKEYRPYDFDLRLAFDVSGISDLNSFEYHYGYINRRPLVSLPLGLYLNQTTGIEAQLDLRQGYFRVNQSTLGFNLYPDLSFYDVQFPHRAFFFSSGSNWNVFFGRDQLEIGSGFYSRLIVSDTPHFVDRVQFSWFLPNLIYTYMVIGFEPWLFPGETDGTSYWLHSRPPLSDGSEHAFPSKTLALHRIDITPWTWLRLSLTEGLMYGGRFPDLRILNPIMILHNLYEWEFASSLFSAELALTPLAGLQLYGQLIMNQISTSYKQENFSIETIPNALGYRLGAQHVLSLGPGFLQTLVEWNHTDPYLYVRENPYITYSWRRRILDNPNGDKLLSLPLGFVHGPDSQSLWLNLTYTVPFKATVSLETEYLRQGEITINSPYSKGIQAAQATTPSGNSTDHLRLTLQAQYQLLRFLSTFGQVTSQSNLTTNQTSFEWSLGVQFQLQPLLTQLTRNP